MERDALAALLRLSNNILRDQVTELKKKVDRLTAENAELQLKVQYWNPPVFDRRAEYQEGEKSITNQTLPCKNGLSKSD